jgi:hypothetical protein
MPACFFQPLFPPRIELGILRVLGAHDIKRHYGNPNAERSSGMANSLTDVDVYVGENYLIDHAKSLCRSIYFLNN